MTREMTQRKRTLQRCMRSPSFFLSPSKNPWESLVFCHSWRIRGLVPCCCLDGCLCPGWMSLFQVSGYEFWYQVAVPDPFQGSICIWITCRWEDTTEYCLIKWNISCIMFRHPFLDSRLLWSNCFLSACYNFLIRSWIVIQRDSHIIFKMALVHRLFRS